jgi:hypothetical protein
VEGQQIWKANMPYTSRTRAKSAVAEITIHLSELIIKHQKKDTEEYRAFLYLQFLIQKSKQPTRQSQQYSKLVSLSANISESCEVNHSYVGAIFQ